MRWDEAEDVDFYLQTRGDTGEGRKWIGLFCSQCGPVQASAEGPPTDLGDLTIAAQRHYERRHAQFGEAHKFAQHTTQEVTRRLSDLGRRMIL